MIVLLFVDYRLFENDSKNTEKIEIFWEVQNLL